MPTHRVGPGIFANVSNMKTQMLKFGGQIDDFQSV